MRPGEPWGSEADAAADLEVVGDDRALGGAHREHPGARIRFVPAPTSDLARALGLRVGDPDDDSAADGTRTELRLDTFLVDLGSPNPDSQGTAAAAPSLLGINLLVAGNGPWMRPWRQIRRHCIVEVGGRPWFEGRATAVVVASGQYRAGSDLVPRGHPGDGRLEVQVYDVAPGQRAELRRRLPTGTHLPHPGIRTTTGREILIRWRRPRPLELDRRHQSNARQARITVRPGTLTLVV